MNTIYKIVLSNHTKGTYVLPQGAKFIHLDLDTREKDKLSAWFQVDNNNPYEQRMFALLVTGANLNKNAIVHGTYIIRDQDKIEDCALHLVEFT